MKTPQTVEITCGGCGKSGKVAKDALKPGNSVKHSAKAGGCGQSMRVR